MARRYYTRKRDVPKLKPGQVLDFKKGRGYYVRPATPPPKPRQAKPAQPQPSIFSGKGLFATSDADCVSGHPCDWVALQMDPEGDESPNIVNNHARIVYWQARPTHDIVAAANNKGIPYIAQAENLPELERALALDVRVPKALVGNPNAWGATQAERKTNQARAAAAGYDLILEWYRNAHPWEQQPDADNYPRYVNCCYGIYGEGVPGGQGYVEQIPLAAYRASHQGPFSVWKAEAMTQADWALFDAS